jgi:N-formylglutamate deformylase
MRSSVFDLVNGKLPLLISIPHMGTYLPSELREDMTNVVGGVPDTDWHLDQLYDFAANMGASMICARVSRYVIDLNRPPDGASLYPEQTTTGLCPHETFHGEPVYRDGREPGDAEVARRVEQYWRPYHDALAQKIQELRRQHGYVLLWEAHSINSLLPRLFEGKLPCFNFGTNDGRSCGAAVQEAIVRMADKLPYTSVVNGRFKGGYITRHYGVPSEDVHAIQLEMAQDVYMNEDAPYSYRLDLAEKVKPVLQSLLEGALAAATAK